MQANLESLAHLIHHITRSAIQTTPTVDIYSVQSQESEFSSHFIPSSWGRKIQRKYMLQFLTIRLIYHDLALGCCCLLVRISLDRGQNFKCKVMLILVSLHGYYFSQIFMKKRKFLKGNISLFILSCFPCR